MARARIAGKRPDEPVVDLGFELKRRESTDRAEKFEMLTLTECLLYSSIVVALPSSGIDAALEMHVDRLIVTRGSLIGRRRSAGGSVEDRTRAGGGHSQRCTASNNCNWEEYQ